MLIESNANMAVGGVLDVNSAFLAIVEL